MGWKYENLSVISDVDLVGRWRVDRGSGSETRSIKARSASQGWCARELSVISIC